MAVTNQSNIEMPQGRTAHITAVLVSDCLFRFSAAKLGHPLHRQANIFITWSSDISCVITVRTRSVSHEISQMFSNGKMAYKNTSGLQTIDVQKGTRLPCYQSASYIRLLYTGRITIEFLQTLHNKRMPILPTWFWRVFRKELYRTMKSVALKCNPIISTDI